VNEGIVVLITAGSDEEAARIAHALVDEHLAACVNIIPAIQSVFFWESKTQTTRESLLVCKSRASLLQRIIDRVKALHSYSVPEIIALPIFGGASDYLAWVQESTGAQPANKTSR
jgi:periplasmic divalent cation tolerance protein